MLYPTLGQEDSLTLKPADNFYAALQAAGLPAVPREFAKEFGLTAGYHSHTASAAKGSYYIIPTFEQKVFNGYLVSQVDDYNARYLCRSAAVRCSG